MAASDTQVGGEHYVKRAVQVWDFIHQNGIGYLAGSAIKYLVRYKEKGGVADLKKARHYLDKLIEEESPKKFVLPPGFEPFDSPERVGFWSACAKCKAEHYACLERHRTFSHFQKDEFESLVEARR